MSVAPAQPPLDAAPAPEPLRTRILAAAIALLEHEGRDALTTRAVAAAAGVQPPALYRLFSDKRALLDAVAEHGFTLYLSEKAAREPHPDPLDHLRAGWDLHIEFGLANPALFAIMSGDPRPEAPSPAEAVGLRHLQQRVQALARAGRLRVPEQRAADLMRATGRGVVLTLLEMPEDQRDLGLSVAAREAVIAAITSAPPPGPDQTAQAAITLRASLPDAASLTVGERALLGEWLDRLARESP